MNKRDFFSDISGSWEDFHADPVELRCLVDFSRHFRLQAGDRVLDIGCGSGRLIPVVCGQIGSGGRLVELDFAPGMLGIARQKPHPDNVGFVLGDAMKLTFANGQFDKVVALAVLPHIDDPAIAFREFHRVLRGDGLLIIAHQMGRRALALHHGGSEAVKNDLLPENGVLRRQLTAAGFTAVEIVDEAERFIAWARA